MSMFDVLCISFVIALLLFDSILSGRKIEALEQRIIRLEFSVMPDNLPTP